MPLVLVANGFSLSTVLYVSVYVELQPVFVGVKVEFRILLNLRQQLAPHLDVLVGTVPRCTNFVAFIVGFDETVRGVGNIHVGGVLSDGSFYVGLLGRIGLGHTFG